jgi:hypothetical protein
VTGLVIAVGAALWLGLLYVLVLEPITWYVRLRRARRRDA